MPLILKERLEENTEQGRLGLWRISEQERELAMGLPLSEAETTQLTAIIGQGRRKEFLAARRLLHQLSGRKLRGSLVKDAYGKPHLEGSDHQVSISHTDALSAAVAHRRHCGVDVQIFVPKISRLAPRFMGSAENAQLTDANRLIFQHLVWSAKEAMYKAYGRREIDFREHLFVELADISLERGETTGQLRKGELCLDYQLSYRIFERNYMLVTAVEAMSEKGPIT